MLKTLENTIVLLFKMVVYGLIFIAFFGLFSINNQQILNPSRTMAVTILTFAVLEAVFVHIYGGYNIGKRKSKPIISSIMLATVITDIITYLQLCIMNTNIANNTQFRLDDLEYLLYVIIVQFVSVYCMTFFGNYVFFKINPPEKCCLIVDNQETLDRLANAVNKFKKQYSIEHIVDYKNEKEVFKTIKTCDTVFVYNIPIDRRKEYVEYCYENKKNIYINMEIADVIEISGKYMVLDDLALLHTSSEGISLEQKIIKRIIDTIVSLLGIFILCPVFLLCAIAIKIDDGGKVFFKQKRACLNGETFWVYKFRTMHENVVNRQASENDDRITRVGAVLRRFRIDEIPQLINILKGEMSLVGPRPLMLEEVEKFEKEIKGFHYRLRVKGGLTGYAQIFGKYNTSAKDKLIMDLMYIENFSLLGDLKLLFQTLMVFLKKDSTEGAKEIESIYRL